MNSTQKENSTQNFDTLHKLVYADKKLSKNILSSINIPLTLESSNNITLKEASIVIHALCKIIERRFKALIEECSQLYQCLTGTIKKTHRIPSSKNITLSINNEGMCINDEMLEFKEEEIIQALESSIFEQPLFEMDIEQSIEQAREGTSLISTVNVNKRRKMIEDRIIEIEENILRGRFILTHEVTSCVDIFKSKLKIDSKLEKIFNISKINEIEDQRRSTVELMDIDFMPESIMHESNTQCEKEVSVIHERNIEEYPNCFYLNDFMQNETNLEKAINFSNILIFLGEGKIRVKQEGAFSRIECIKV